MSLQGSLETFALPDVLVLLASTKKDGELEVSGAKVDGRIWVEKGQIVHSDVNGKERPSVDAVFELLRLDEGSFVFEADRPTPARHEPETIDVVLADAQVRLGEWKEIAKVVPHLGVVVDMADKAPGDSVTITAAQWRLLRAFAGGSSVAAMMASQDMDEFDACKAVKELFEADLVSLDLSAKPEAKRDVEAGGASGTDPAPAAKAAGETAPAAKAADMPAEMPAGVHRRPADLPEAKVEAKPAAASADQPDPKRVEEVKSEVERELAALADEAAKTEPARPKVRATTHTPGSVAVAEPAARGGANSPSANGPSANGPSANGPSGANGAANGSPAGSNGKAADPKPQEKQALVAQLAALEGENEEKIAKKVEEHLARGGELPEVGEGDEPINRGLLLKFLSSVRN